MVKLSPEDEARIDAAVADAELRTTGEIMPMITRRCSSYAETPFAYAAFLSLLIPLAVTAAGLEPWTWGAGWRVRAPEPEQAVFAYALLQAGVFLLVLALTAWRPVRMFLAPRPLKRARVHRTALQQFLSKGLHQTEARTGVLILASLEERHAEIVADEGIYAKVDPEVWAEALAALIAGMKRNEPARGFVEAINLCGEVLARHFPPTPENPNELPDRVVIL